MLYYAGQGASAMLILHARIARKEQRDGAGTRVTAYHIAERQYLGGKPELGLYLVATYFASS